jgi:hypothetical protein
MLHTHLDTIATAQISEHFRDNLPMKCVIIHYIYWLSRPIVKSLKEMISSGVTHLP